MKIYDSKKLGTLPDVFLFDTDNTLYSYDAPHKAAMLAVKSKVASMFLYQIVTFNHLLLLVEKM